MKHYKLTAEQAAANAGHTDLFVLTHADLTVTTDDLLQTIDLDALEFGDVVKAETVLEVVTACDNASANETLTISVGITTSVAAFLAASTINSSGTAVAAKTTFAAAAAIEPYAVPTGGKTLSVTFDITDTDGDLATHAAGEWRIWMTISRWSERQISC